MKNSWDGESDLCEQSQERTVEAELRSADWRSRVQKKDIGKDKNSEEFEKLFGRAEKVLVGVFVGRQGWRKNAIVCELWRLLLTAVAGNYSPVKF